MLDGSKLIVQKNSLAGSCINVATICEILPSLMEYPVILSHTLRIMSVLIIQKEKLVCCV